MLKLNQVALTVSRIQSLTERKEGLWYFEHHQIPDFESIFEACELYQAAVDSGREVETGCKEIIEAALERVLAYHCPLTAEEWRELDYDDRESVNFIAELTGAVEWLLKPCFADHCYHRVFDIVRRDHISEEVRVYALTRLTDIGLSAKGQVADQSYQLLKDAAYGRIFNGHRCEIVTAFLSSYADEPELIGLLEQLLVQEAEAPYWLARLISEKLAQRTDVQTFLLTKLHAAADERWLEFFATALDAQWEDGTALKGIAQSYLISHHDPSVRCRGLSLMLRYEASEVVEPQMLQALKDSDDWVRRFVLENLHRLELSLDRHLQLLQQVVDTDEDIFVQDEALQVLKANWGERSDWHFWLRRCAESNQHNVTRLEALEMVLETQPNSAHQFVWLKSCYGKEECRIVRERLVELVGKYHREQPELIPWLEHVARSDPEHEVRYAAESLIYWYSRE
ncbi:HEAT repeat domain-containing protein [Pontibacterium granulatum]|uniref:HEAT repeat domain-containing protein n=1 Tax=Pontibacterium granulatum TaxID=2036029 RepID=UPI00249B4C7D|nr:HEAT repeat domain-containing protein [Pontibacterium granulatum]MDI3324053.1 HEAT repeat domain-containing protein [Pontibacterium granulatum]